MQSRLWLASAAAMTLVATGVFVASSTVHGQAPTVPGSDTTPDAGTLSRDIDRAVRQALSAHQLATPLSSLSGWLELLREQSDRRAVDVGDRAHGGRSRATAARVAPLRAHRTAAAPRRGRSRRAGGAGGKLLPGARAHARASRHDRGLGRKRAAHDRRRRGAARVGARGARQERTRCARRPRRPHVHHDEASRSRSCAPARCG